MTDCVHHWLIDTPSGATSQGTCQNCGEIRDFTNRSPDLNIKKFYSLTAQTRREAAEYQKEITDILYRANEHAGAQYDNTWHL